MAMLQPGLGNAHDKDDDVINVSAPQRSFSFSLIPNIQLIILI